VETIPGVKLETHARYAFSDKLSGKDEPGTFGSPEHFTAALFTLLQHAGEIIKIERG